MNCFLRLFLVHLCIMLLLPYAILLRAIFFMISKASKIIGHIMHQTRYGKCYVSDSEMKVNLV